MNKETIVLSLRQVGFDQAQGLQMVNAMEDVYGWKVNPALAKIDTALAEMKASNAEMKAAFHQEISNQTWKLMGLMIAAAGVFAAILKYVH